ncbi:disulfide bond formation protein DsbA [Aeromicrobium sp. PE09-221]|uniref:DsbA family protein n=1 Tax=Aeromicrobium sp. PE09-221 TaxID=1898043 RepID=UPI000B3E8748|nr:thioredoxin domain-containing protein [Aeromicrobium sp. PE09-221]OUZ07208.1 disulfide bond formation protein DsbA [Aeromicrobium sp. PE09-221]
MSRTTRAIVTLAVVITALLTLAALVLFQMSSSDQDKQAAAEVSTVEDNSHRLQEADNPDAPVFVEFLDFECEACGAAYPVIEDLREQYAGKVTFVVRYFPLPGHRNSRNAAHAVEAAARQDALEPMYQLMFETQASWGESQDDRSELFRSYAERLGLDLDQYDRDVASDSVAQRVQQDYDAAIALDLSGTPSFFIDDEPLQPQSLQDMTDAIDAAIARR